MSTRNTIQVRLSAEEADDPKALLHALNTVLDHELGITLTVHVEGGSAATAPPDARARDAAWDRFLAETREWSKALPPGHFVDDDRESIYEGRGE